MKKLSQFTGAWPFFAAVFLNAFVDLGHKITIQNTVFKLYDGEVQVIATAILNGLILLPFILLLSPAGFISDRFARVRVMRISAWAALGLCVLICCSYYQGWYHAAFAATFLLAVQSAIYSPAKYAYIKELFGKARLGQANGVVSALSIVAILAGIFAFSIVFELLYVEGLNSEAAILKTIAPIGILLVLSAGLEVLMMYRLPQHSEFNVGAQAIIAEGGLTNDGLGSDGPGNDGLGNESVIEEGAAEDRTVEESSIQYSSAETSSAETSSAEASSAEKISDTSNAESPKAFAWGRFLSGRSFADDLQPLKNHRPIRLAVIGLSTFWAIGQVMLAAFPAFFKAQTGIDNAIAVQGILACSGIGIAFGSGIAGRMSKDHIELGLLPVGAFGLALGLLFLPTLTSPIASALDFLWIGFMGGIFIVPLNALIQFQAREGEVGKTLAANNWLQNVTMLSFLLLTVSFSLLDLSSKTLLHIIAIVAVIGCGYTVYQLPQSFVRILLAFILRRHYRVQVQGMKNLPAQGGALLLGNHVSWIDWAIIQLASPRPVRFVMIRSIYERWYLKWIFDLFGCIPIEQGPRSRESFKKIRELLEAGELVCLFPEGTLSRTGHLVEFRKGFERACEGLSVEVPIIPFYLHGLWGSQFSKSTSMLRRDRRFGSNRNLVVAFGEPIPNSTPADILKRKLFDLSVSSWEEHCKEFSNIGAQWVQSAKSQGRRFCMADSTGTTMTGVQALTASCVLSHSLRAKINSKNVGVILPSSVGGALANMALLQAGKTIVNLNYTAGNSALSSALARAEIDTVVTSKQFLLKLKRKRIELDTVLEGVKVIELEALKPSISLASKVYAYLACRLLPTGLLSWLMTSGLDSDDTAAILFSSGSEGEPKGVCLSHKNILANVKQTMTVLNPEDSDVMMGNLPFFHAFGLTATQFLPLLESLPVVYHPDPTDSVSCAKLIARYQATIMFGTSTFLRLYVRNKNVHPLMLQSMRLVISGAEKLNEQVRIGFKQKFNLEIFEGYGATEATPVVSVNLPDKLGLQDFKVQLGSRRGSVGLPLPGSSIKIVDPQSYSELPTGEAGMVLIGGVQVMQGYLKDKEKTDSVITIIDGRRWYVTGDKGHLDEDGFLTIVDRYSRFAKIGGEMLSLGRIERAIQNLVIAGKVAQVSDADEDLELALVALPDDKRGERLILLSEEPIEVYITTEGFQSQGLSNLAIPSRVFVVDALPKLASGKMNFSALKALAVTLVSE
ncbi:MAG: acyl-[acyl-carrier-protein]-phospholipid O-acyltransferase [Flavobacteriales bacterium]|jgi:acyl-[acyl-carrier-protein]-phospholipid O-acyltransferase/long-chain-fatty-acid--[acyl-carrier-protein] ligase